MVSFTPLCGAWSNGLEIAIDFPPSLHQIIIHLQAEKEALRQSEIARQPQVGLRNSSRRTSPECGFGSSPPSGVVVDDFDTGRSSFIPNKADWRRPALLIMPLF
jgi:hypothetical protein